MWRRGWVQLRLWRHVWGSVRWVGASGRCLGRLDRAGLFVGNGLGAAGLTIGPFAGRLLAEAVLEREPALGLAAFDPMRRVSPMGREAVLR